MSAESNQYLTFQLVDEQYALEVHKVQEVLEMQSITHIPGMPQYMRGVINIRGKVVPVVDLRTKLGLPPTDNNAKPSIIVVEISQGEDQITMGCLADSVQEVTNLDDSALEPPPKMGTSIQSVWIKAIGKQDDKFVILLDIERIFNFDELSQVYKDSE